MDDQKSESALPTADPSDVSSNIYLENAILGELEALEVISEAETVVDDALAEAEDEDEPEESPQPMIISKSSSKTLRWISGLLEALYGSTESPILPMSNFPNVPFEERRVALLDFEASDFEQPVTYENVSTLSKLVNIRVRFRIGWTSDEKTESFVVKLPPEGIDERELALMSRADRREIYCYTRVFPYMQQWCLEQNIDVVFAVPRCYYGHIDRRLDTKPVPSILDNIPEAESLLVFQDLRPLGFGKRHFVEGLGLEEVKAAICEIAKIHAISYVVQHKKKTHLAQLFSPLHKPEDIALMYEVLLADTLPELKKFVAKNRHDARDILGRIRKLEIRLKQVLSQLMEPHPPPYPTCLTHLDFWCDNIVFRRRDYWENYSGPWSAKSETDAEQEEVSGSASTTDSTVSVTLNNSIELGMRLTPKSLKVETEIQDSPLECRILDWQMVSYGRPTHDLALLLMASLPTQLRRKYTNTLLKYYLQVFQNTTSIFGVDIYFDFHWFHNEYKKSKLLAVLFAVASIQLAVSDPITQERLMDSLNELVAEGHL